MSKLIPVILCGGSGTRLWPFSRSQTPKQFLKLLDNDTLLQKTARRTLDAIKDQNVDIVVVTLGLHAEEVRQQLKAISSRLVPHILSEPSGQNTAAAVSLASLYVEKKFGSGSLMWVLPADHYIGEECILNEAMNSGRSLAEEGYLVTFGIEPTRPETGYGYIRKGNKLDNANIYEATEFVEKPPREIAEQYMDSGEYYWSSGMHLFKTSTVLENYKIYAPEILEAVKSATQDSLTHPSSELYITIRKDPFESAVMEKAQRIAVIACDPKWSDIGSWESLWEIKNKDEFGNTSEGNVYLEDTRNSMIISKKRLVTCVGLEDVVIVEMDDAVLVANKRSNASLKRLVERLAASKRKEIQINRTQEFLWGCSRQIVDNRDMSITEITVRPRCSAEQLYNGDGSNLCIVEGAGHISYGKQGGDLKFASGNGTHSFYRITNDGDDDLVIYKIAQKSAQHSIPATRMKVEHAQTLRTLNS